MATVNGKVGYGSDDVDIPIAPVTPVPIMAETGVLNNNNNNNSVVQDAPAPAPAAVPGSLVRVAAPMDLQAGYQLQITSASGQKQFVIVPEGGVRQGLSFQAQAFTIVGESATTGNKMENHIIPSGHWRDGLCDCCTLGCFHPMFWLGWCFEPILVGQIMTRMSRDMFGGQGQRSLTSNTCKIVTGIFVLYLLTIMTLSIVMDTESCFGASEQYNDVTGEIYLVCLDGTVMPTTAVYDAVRTTLSVVSWCFFIYILIATCRTRQAIRNKYNIAPTCCGGCEDCCCSFWCSCCTVQQMARHTNDYHEYPVKCCSNACCNKRGQPVEVPEIEL